MRKLTFGMFAVAVAAMTLGSAYSQPPEDREGPPRGREGRPERGERGPGRGGPGGPGGFRGGPGGPPLLVALDTDKDGELSAEEISNAATALKTLDKNNDGKLTRDEMRPPRGQGRPGEAGPGGRPGEAGGPGRPGRGGPRGFDFAARFEQFDKNGDGKLTKEELPERMQRILERADSNSDGALDKDELKAMAERFKNREGGRPPRGERPEGGRPKRPSNDE